MKKRAALLILAGWIFTAASLPASVPRLGEFRRVLVLDQGRVKPLDTFARSLLKQFSGRSAPGGMNAGAWLARSIFAPESTHADALFLVQQPDLLDAMGVKNDGRGRYSYSRLRPGLRKLHELAYRYSSLAESDLGRVERETLRLFYNLSVFHGLANSFAFAREDEGTETSTGSASSLPAILPLAAEQWLSPGQALGNAATPSAVRREVSLLAEAARAYAAGDQHGFDQALEAFNRSVLGRLKQEAIRPWKVTVEILYHRVDPFFKAGLAYALALLLLLLAPACRRPLFARLGWWSMLAGSLLHTLGLVARMLITGRPPVTNLYETFVFVAWTAVALGLVMAGVQKQGPGLACGGLAALSLLVIAGRHALEGDTMGMLAAVLDSNLWLATHVVTIALGYAGCVVAGIIGHAVIIQEIRGQRPAAAAAARSLYAVLAFGLAFTTIGTLMGGIWADQSWGRFWGWDPKENGALLIIIWCAVLFHARLAGWIGPIGLAAGAIGSIITVALAWFGVNLLGVGLHAYGFTSGTARGLLIFIVAELAFLAAAVPLARKRSRA